MKHILRTLFSFLFLLSVTACGFINLSTVRRELNSIGRDVNADSEVFYVDLDVNAYESNNHKPPHYDINRIDQFGDSQYRQSPSNCEIKPSPRDKRLSTEPILCILDIPEFEFALKDFHIVFSVPEEICDTVSVSHPWHFNYEMHPGPVVEQCSFSSGGGDGDTAATESLYCDVSKSNSQCPNPEDTIPTNYCKKDEEDLCPGGPGEPACCVGGERAGGEGAPWKPDRDCFGGPGSFQYNPADNVVAPVVLIALPKNGLRKTETFPHLLSFNKKDRTTAPYANFLKILDVDEVEDLEKARENSKFPDFLKKSTHYNQSPRLAFEFACLDSAREVLHRILLLVREWNTFEEFKIFYDAQGEDTADPDVDGSEGVDCNEDQESSSGEHAKCNDERDLDDYDALDVYPKVEYKRK